MTSILAMVAAMILAVNGLFSAASVTAEKMSNATEIIHDVDDAEIKADVDEADVEAEEKTGSIDFAHYYMCKDFGNMRRGSTSMARTGAFDLCYAMAIEQVTGMPVDIHQLVNKYVSRDNLLYTSVLLNDVGMKEMALDFTTDAVRQEVDAGNPVVVVFKTDRGTMSPCIVTGYDAKGISLWSPAYGKVKLPYTINVSKRVMSARVLTSNSDK